MAGFDLQTILYVLGGALGGAVVVWLLGLLRGKLRLRKVNRDWQHRLDEAVRENEQLTAEVEKLRIAVDAERANTQQISVAGKAARTEIESQEEKAKMLSKDLFMIGAERDELKGQVTNFQNALNTAKNQVAALQAGQNKGSDIYKAQLATAIEERKILERKLEDSRSEHQSLNRLLASARSEYDSATRLLKTAQSRMKDLKKLTEKVSKLEAANVQLEHKATLATREAESLRRDEKELDSLKEQNSQLMRCLESIDVARKQHESDAHRYRSQYEKSEKESDTLRFKIEDIRKAWAHKQNLAAKPIESGNGKENGLSTFGLSKPDGEIDNLTDIVGIGQAIEKSLHELGIFHYRQIAAFGPLEIARINSELKQFSGRIEHDDWIGQARDLHFKKYGSH